MYTIKPHVLPQYTINKLQHVFSNYQNIYYQNIYYPVVEGPQLPEGYIPPSSSSESAEKNAETEEESGKNDITEWFEAVSDMGYPYYWNTATGGNCYYIL